MSAPTETSTRLSLSAPCSEVHASSISSATANFVPDLSVRRHSEVLGGGVQGGGTSAGLWVDYGLWGCLICTTPGAELLLTNFNGCVGLNTFCNLECQSLAGLNCWEVDSHGEHHAVRASALPGPPPMGSATPCVWGYSLQQSSQELRQGVWGNPFAPVLLGPGPGSFRNAAFWSADFNASQDPQHRNAKSINYHGQVRR